ncbi:MAG TPA: tail fiber domain-containing protein, partial [Lautropia sp.]|nr:tail fiber domain-containing protein [Lautropia sp.]
LRPVFFRWKHEAEMGERREVSFIAQEVAEVMPEVVGQRSDGLLTLDYAKLVTPLTGAVQTLEAELAALREENRELVALREEYRKLARRLDALET